MTAERIPHIKGAFDRSELVGFEYQDHGGIIRLCVYTRGGAVRHWDFESEDQRRECSRWLCCDPEGGE